MLKLAIVKRSLLNHSEPPNLDGSA